MARTKNATGTRNKSYSGNVIKEHRTRGMGFAPRVRHLKQREKHQWDTFTGQHLAMTKPEKRRLVRDVIRVNFGRPDGPVEMRNVIVLVPDERDYRATGGA